MNEDQSNQPSLDELQQRVAELEAELKALRPPAPSESDKPATWTRSGGRFYWTYFAWAGAILGMFGAVASLLVNVIGSLVVGQHPLRLIQVYLTFPMGEKALAEDLDTGIILAVGCCLYIFTGMLLAIPIHLLFARFLPNSTLIQRLLLATVAALLMWAVNFYLILSWLQPLLFGGNWITDPALMPPWIGAGTHVVFAWVVAALYPWGTLDVESPGNASRGYLSAS